MRVAHRTHPVARGKKITVTVAWNGVPAPSFAPGSTTPYSFAALIDGYSASTDVVTVAPGSVALPSWLQISGATLVPNGTQVDGNDFSGLILRVTRTGASTPADSASFAVQVTNLAPVWVTTPNPEFMADVSSVFPPTGTYQSNGYVTDADGDPLTITKNSVPVQGLVWTGSRFEFDGTGSAQVVGGHILTANDGQGHLVQSAAFTVTIQANITYGWNQALTDIYLPQGGAFALTNEYVEAPGEVPAWGIIDGEALLESEGVTLVNGSLVHDNRANVDTIIEPTRFTSASATGSLTFAGAALGPTQMVPPYYNLPGAVTINYGKHWNWTQTPDANGVFRCWSADGAYDGNGNTGRFFGFNPTTATLAHWYPFVGIPGKTFPVGQDGSFVRRDNADTPNRGDYHFLRGYWANHVELDGEADVSTTIAGFGTYDVQINSSNVTDSGADGDPWQVTVDNTNNIDSANFTVADITAFDPPLPAGISVLTAPNGTHKVRISRINVLGDQDGHGDDHARFAVYLTNTSGAPITIPPTTFTIQIFSSYAWSFTFDGTSASQYLWPTHTIALMVDVPSYNQDPTKWYVPGDRATRHHMTPSVPGIVLSSRVTQMNTPSDDYRWYYPDPAPGFYTYPFADERGTLTVTLTNTTPNPIVVNTNVVGSIFRPVGDAAYTIDNGGTPRAGGTWRLDIATNDWTVKKRPNFPDYAGESWSGCDDPVRDCAWLVSAAGLQKYEYSSQTIIATYPLSNNFGSTGYLIHKSRMGFSPSRQEAYYMGNIVDGANSPIYIMGVKTSAGDEGDTRIVATIVAGGTGLTAVSPDIHALVFSELHGKCVLFLPHCMDWTNINGGSIVGDGGAFVVDVDTGTFTRVPYPSATIQAAEPTAGIPTVFDSQLYPAMYSGFCDPRDGAIYTTNHNGQNIWKWVWS
jgi:hypothetical protein